MAVCRGDIEVVRALLTKTDVDVHVTNVNGHTPLDLARNNYKLEIRQLLEGFESEV